MTGIAYAAAENWGRTLGGSREVIFQILPDLHKLSKLRVNTDVLNTGAGYGSKMSAFERGQHG